MTRTQLSTKNGHPAAPSLNTARTAATENSGEVLNSGEAAGYLRVKSRTLDTWRKQGLVPYIKIGKARNAAVRFKKSDLETMLENWRVN